MRIALIMLSTIISFFLFNRRTTSRRSKYTFCIPEFLKAKAQQKHHASMQDDGDGDDFFQDEGEGHQDEKPMERMVKNFNNFTDAAQKVLNMELQSFILP